MLEKEQAFYETHRDEIRANYIGKEVVLTADRIIGAYDDVGEAYDEAIKVAKLGHFMIKYIPEDPTKETIHIIPTIQYG
jgi:hypothetical protein